MRIISLTWSTWKVQTKWRSSKHCQDDALESSTYPVHRSASEINSSGADAQVVSFDCYLVVFHLLVEQFANCLLYIWTCSVTGVLRVLNLDLHRNGIMSTTCQRGT